MTDYCYIAKSVVETERFKGMPLSAQGIYFQLVMHADDNGQVSDPNDVVKSARASCCDLHSLAENGLIAFEPCGVSIVHWEEHGNGGASYRKR